MDIRCSVCLEPWDMDTLHEVASEQHSTFDRVYAAFRRDGCGTFGWSSCDPVTARADRAHGLIVSELAELLGDDVDGMAAMLEDFGL